MKADPNGAADRLSAPAGNGCQWRTGGTAENGRIPVDASALPMTLPTPTAIV
jgi:hypothetical protein